MLYGSETLNNLEVTKKRLNSFESKSHRRTLNITYRQRKTNLYIHLEMIYIYRIGSYKRILQNVRKRK